MEFVKVKSEIYDKVDNSTLKISLMTTDIESIMARTRSNGKIRMKLLDETLKHLHRGLIFPKHHSLFQAVNTKIGQLTSGGLIEYFKFENVNISNLEAMQFKNIQPEIYEPIVLTMDHLYIGFAIWACCLALSFLVFIGENIVYYSNRRFKKITPK